MTEDPVFGKHRLYQPSFGMLNITRGVCNKPMNLFGNSIKQHSYIEIRISKAEMYRNLNRDDIFEKETIISINMSPSQFADAITSLNSGGTPCTIAFVEGHEVKPPVLESQRVMFDKEFEDKMAQVASDISPFYEAIQKILSKPNIGKHDRENILKEIDMLKMQIEKNIPFMKEQFTEQMNQTVNEAKAEVDAFIEHKLKHLGLEKFKDQLALEFTGEEK